MEHVILAIGLVLIVEGLAYALAPSLVEQLLELLKTLPEAMRRNLGFSALALGLALVWLAKLLGACGVAQRCALPRAQVFSAVGALPLGFGWGECHFCPILSKNKMSGSPPLHALLKKSLFGVSCTSAPLDRC